MNGYLAVIGKLRDSAAANLVGGSGVDIARIFPGDPQDEQVYPCISVENFDADAFDTKSGYATTDHDLVKVFCYSPTDGGDNGANAIAGLCRTVLDGASGTMNSLVVENIRWLRVDTYDVHLTNRRVRVHEQDYEVRIRVNQ